MWGFPESLNLFQRQLAAYSMVVPMQIFTWSKHLTFRAICENMTFVKWTSHPRHLPAKANISWLVQKAFIIISILYS